MQDFALLRMVDKNRANTASEKTAERRAYNAQWVFVHEDNDAAREWNAKVTTLVFPRLTNQQENVKTLRRARPDTWQLYDSLNKNPSAPGEDRPDPGKVRAEAFTWLRERSDGEADQQWVATLAFPNVEPALVQDQLRDWDQFDDRQRAAAMDRLSVINDLS